MICWACGTLDTRDPRPLCARCGRPRAPATPANLQRLLEEHVARTSWSVVQTWVAYGQIDPAMASWLAERYHPRGPVDAAAPAQPAIAAETPPSNEPTPTAAMLPMTPMTPMLPMQPMAQTPAAALPAAPWMPMGPSAPAVAAPPAKPPPAPSTWDREVRPLLNENVGWFVGALLVLAGSIYGVREAWRSFGGVARHLVVGGALVAYVAAFVGLARFVAKRSEATARVLGSIGIALLPVASVAFASLVAIDLGVGLTAMLGFAVVAALLTRALGRRFSLHRPWELAAALVPSLLAEGALLGAPVPPLTRVLAPFVGVLACAWAAFRVPAETEPRTAVEPKAEGVDGDADQAGDASARPTGSYALLGAAAYGAGALAVVALTSGPLAPAPGTLATGALVWIAAMASIVAAGARTAPSVARFGIAARVLGTLASVALAATPLAAMLLRASDREIYGHGGPLWALGVASVIAVSSLVTASRAHAWVMHLVGLTGPFAAHLAVVALLDLAGRPSPGAAPHALRVAVAALSPVLLLVGSRALEPGRARIARGWGVLTGASLLAIVFAAEASFTDDRSPCLVTAYTAALLAIAAHGSGFLVRRGVHLFGGLAAIGAVLLAFVPGAPVPELRAVELLIVGGLAYAVLGGVATWRALRSTSAPADAPASRFEPLDDVSRLALLAAVPFALSLVRSAPHFLLDGGKLALAWPIEAPVRLAVVAALALFARALRDRSRLLGGLATVALAVPLVAVLGGSDATSRALGGALVALAFSLLATSRPAGEPPLLPRHWFLGEVALAGATSPRFLVADAFGAGGALVAFRSALPLVVWLHGEGPGVSRGVAVLAALVLAGVAALAFATRSLAVLRARGAVEVLYATLGALLAALVIDRLGRDRTPLDDATAFSVIALGLAGLAHVALHLGPSIAARLGAKLRPRYADPFAAAAVAIVAVLVVAGLAAPTPALSAVMLVTPPVAFFGAAATVGIVALAYRARAVGHVAFVLASMGGALACAQRAPFGVALARLPGGTWVPAARRAAFALGVSEHDVAALLDPSDAWVALWSRGLRGLALVALVAGLVAVAWTRRPAAWRAAGPVDLAGADASPFVDRALAGGLVVVALLSIRADFGSALLALGVAILLLAARAPGSGLLLAPFALAGALHALALSHGAVIPAFGAPSLALASLGLVALAARRPAAPGWPQARALALAPLLLAAVYALAVAAPIDPMHAARTLAEGVATADVGAPPRWLRHLGAIAGVAAPATVASLVAARVWSLRANELATVESAIAGLFWSLACMTGIAAVALLAAPSVAMLPMMPLSLGDAGALLAFGRGLAPAAALGLALSALGCEAAGVFSSRAFALVPALRAPASPGVAGMAGAADDPRLARGLGFSRDVALVALLPLAALAVTLAGRAVGEAGAFASPSAGFACELLALGVALVLAARVAFVRTSPAHVYLVELLAIAGYLLVRAARGRHLPREVDATILLVLGFVLVGVVSRARGTRADVIASPLRTLAALLPLAIAGILARGGAHPSYLAAAFAAGASALYGALGWAERSRTMWSFGAVAANVALLLALLSSGLSGFEFYAAPAGLALLAIGHLWSARVDAGGRLGVRIAGGLLLYGPAAVRLSFRLGDGASGAYAVAFGAICLLGLAAGMLLHIRAYLALGTTFLALDVIANLLAVGLRDHRIGFLLLSATGLAILGVMVVVTTRREAVTSALERARGRIRGWD
jgi:hypothetical protein